MFSSCGHILCRACNQKMTLSLIEPVGAGNNQITFRCTNCEAERALVSGPKTVRSDELTTVQ